VHVHLWALKAWLAASAKIVWASYSVGNKPASGGSVKMQSMAKALTADAILLLVSSLPAGSVRSCCG